METPPFPPTLKLNRFDDPKNPWWSEMTSTISDTDQVTPKANRFEDPKDPWWATPGMVLPISDTPILFPPTPSPIPSPVMRSSISTPPQMWRDRSTWPESGTCSDYSPIPYSEPLSEGSDDVFYTEYPECDIPDTQL